MKLRLLALLCIASMSMPLLSEQPQPLIIRTIESRYQGHIIFFTALYLDQTGKSVPVPSIHRFITAVKKEIQNPAHQAPFGSEGGDQLIAQLAQMYLDTDGSFLIKKYKAEGRTAFIDFLTTQQ